MVDMQSASAEIRRGKKKERRKKKPQDKNINGLPYYIGWPYKKIKTADGQTGT